MNRYYLSSFRWEARHARSADVSKEAPSSNVWSPQGEGATNHVLLVSFQVQDGAVQLVAATSYPYTLFYPILFPFYPRGTREKRPRSRVLDNAMQYS